MIKVHRLQLLIDRPDVGTAQLDIHPGVDALEDALGLRQKLGTRIDQNRLNLR